jgi:phospho-N-acetylmuramoyl-pentapeptide-transferase
MKKLRVKQYLREEGPKSHAHKKDTPTSGGVCILVSACVETVGWWIYSHGAHPEVLIVLAWGLICGFIGLADDTAKVRQKANKGVSGKVRLAIETATGIGLGLMLFTREHGYWLPGDPDPNTPINPMVLVHASPHHFGIIGFILLAAFLTAATTNAVNLHDGMDGLAAGTTALVFATMSVILLGIGNESLAVVSAIMAGAVLGFLMRNRYPANIFMGDTGSLFIGGMMAAIVIAGGIVVWFVPLSLIYIVETLSVMIQVPYYKLTKPYTPDKPMSAPALALYKLTHKLPGEGKRVFRMTPIHHHFEAVLGDKGVPEAQVVLYFWLVQLGLSIAVLAIFCGWR